MKQKPSFLNNLPSIVWLLIIALGLISIIAGIWLLFYLAATVEGVVSFIFLLLGFGYLRSQYKNRGSEVDKAYKKTTGYKLTIAAIILFWALMGMAIDQTGNYVYNKPIEVLFCDEGSSLNRGTFTRHPLPERTDIVQSYDCFDNNSEFVNSIGLEKVILVRFIEYVTLGYVFYYSGEAIKYIKRRSLNKKNSKLKQ